MLIVTSAPQHTGAILLDPKSSADAASACTAIGEQLLPVNGTFFSTDFTNITYDTKSQILAFSEPAVAIIASCSPLLKPLLDQILGRFYHKSRTSKPSRLSGLASRTIGGSSGRSYPRTPAGRFMPMDESQEYLELGSLSTSPEIRSSEIIDQEQISREGHGSAPSRSIDSLRGIVVKRETTVIRQER